MSVSFADSMHGWAVRTDAAIYRTNDGGLSWSVVPTDLRQRTDGYLLGSVDFVDQKNGFASAYDDLSGAKLMWLKTSDGGRTWSVVRTS